MVERSSSEKLRLTVIRWKHHECVVAFFLFYLYWELVPRPLALATSPKLAFFDRRVFVFSNGGTSTITSPSCFGVLRRYAGKTYRLFTRTSQIIQQQQQVDCLSIVEVSLKKSVSTISLLLYLFVSESAIDSIEVKLHQRNEHVGVTAFAHASKVGYLSLQYAMLFNNVAFA